MAGQLVAPGIRRFHSRFVNWYLLEEDERLAAVDAGLPPDWNELVAALAGLGRTPRDLTAVLLTHAHVDHLGFAERARREAGATVYAHEAELDLVQQRLRIAPSERSPLRYLGYPATRRAMYSLLRTGAFRGKPVREVTTVRHGETLADVPGRPRAVFTPGHTFGHAAFHLSERDLVFTGDALVTRNPYTGRRGPQTVARAATADAERALESLDWIAETNARTLLTGHGAPWNEGAAEAVRLAKIAGVS